MSEDVKNEDKKPAVEAITIEFKSQSGESTKFKVLRLSCATEEHPG
jgi:hypothetical protein